MLPNIDELVPAGTCHQPFDEHAHIDPDRELRVVIVSSDERVLHHIIPRAHRHVVRARHQEAPGVRREFELPDGVAVTAEHGERRPVRPDVPHPRHEHAYCVYITVARVPYGGVDAVSVFVESTDGGRAVECPELDGVVPGGGDERVTADGVVVNR